MAQQSRISRYATERARLLLGCYRTGDANDPETYVAAIAASLARFPEEIITEVTHPVDGLPARLSWLPTVKDIRDACDAAMEPTRRRALADRQIKEQLADRAEPDRTNRPTSDDMKSKYGANWGLEADRRGEEFGPDRVKSILSQPLSAHQLCASLSREVRAWSQDVAGDDITIVALAIA